MKLPFFTNQIVINRIFCFIEVGQIKEGKKGNVELVFLQQQKKTHVEMIKPTNSRVSDYFLATLVALHFTPVSK